MVIQKKLYTVEEFEQIAAQDQRLLELINGEIVEKMPTEEHGLIAGNIQAFLWNYTRPRGLGRPAVEVRHQLPKDKQNARMPDVSYNLPSDRPVVQKGSVPKMPDLAVEVKSPDDSPKEMREKADYYLNNGSRLVWLVFPDRKEIEVFSTDHSEGKILTVEDTLTGDNVLPDFTVAVKEIFDLN